MTYLQALAASEAHQLPLAASQHQSINALHGLAALDCTASDSCLHRLRTLALQVLYRHSKTLLVTASLYQSRSLLRHIVLAMHGHSNRTIAEAQGMGVPNQEQVNALAHVRDVRHEH